MTPEQTAFYQKYFPANLAAEVKKVFGKKMPDIVKEFIELAGHARSDVTVANNWTKKAQDLVNSFDYDNLYNRWIVFVDSAPYQEFLSLISMLPVDQSEDLENDIINIANLASEDYFEHEADVDKLWDRFNRKVIKYFDKLPEKVKAKTKSDLVGESLAVEQILSDATSI